MLHTMEGKFMWSLWKYSSCVNFASAVILLSCCTLRSLFPAWLCCLSEHGWQ